MPYASYLASCSMEWFLVALCVVQLVLRHSPSWNSDCLLVICLMQLSFSKDMGFCSLFYLGYFHTASWDSLCGLCALCDSLSSFQSLLLDRCTLGWPVWPVIGYPLLGLHPSTSVVRLIMIGYCCNFFEGQLN